MATQYRNLIEIPERGYHYFRHYFIPHEGNNHHPLVLRPRALKVYSALLIAVKVFLTGFLYISYPTEAQFAELTASHIFDLTNTSRVDNGANSLRLNALLTRAAKAKADDMIRLGYFDHTGPDGKKFWQWIKEAGYSYTTAGENLAMDFTTAESAHRALMESPSHRQNILKASYTEIGLAVAEGTLNGRETTVLVEYFGSPSPVKKVAKKPSTETPKTPETPPATPTRTSYQAELVGTSDEKYLLQPGSEVSVWVDFRNSGTETWYRDRGTFVALNVTNPPGRTSVFRHSSWPARYRPARLSQQTVRPGKIGRFLFTLKAPKIPGKTTESFALVAENLTWIEGGAVNLSLTVVAPKPAVAAAEAPLPTPQEQIQEVFGNTSNIEVTDHAGDQAVTPGPAEQPEPLRVSIPGVSSDWKRTVTDWTVRFFWAFLIFLSLSLILTVMIRIRIQHRHAILQSLLVLSLTAFLLTVPLHYAERIVTILLG
jgi:uncharacterized protein YkwD